MNESTTFYDFGTCKLYKQVKPSCR